MGGGINGRREAETRRQVDYFIFGAVGIGAVADSPRDADGL